jgi:hypothetical protein
MKSLTKCQASGKKVFPRGTQPLEGSAEPQKCFSPDKNRQIPTAPIFAAEFGHAKKGEGGYFNRKIGAKSGKMGKNDGKRRFFRIILDRSYRVSPLPRRFLHPAIEWINPQSKSGDMATPLPNPIETRSIADLLGPWQDSDFESGLIQRCKLAWNKPRQELTNEELATLLRQEIATEFILPEARYRLDNKIDDDSEMFEGELREAVQAADRSIVK